MIMTNLKPQRVRSDRRSAAGSIAVGVCPKLDGPEVNNCGSSVDARMHLLAVIDA